MKHSTPTTDCSDQQFSSVDFTTSPPEFTEAYDCIFEGCNFQEVDLGHSKFNDCEFRHCNFSVTKIANAVFRGCKFIGCKALGVNWSSAQRIENCRFTECNMTSAVLMHRDLRNFVFEDSILVDVDFSAANMQRAQFKNCDLAGAMFRNTNLARADFSTAKNYDIDPKINILAKAKFSMPEAISLLSGLGIELV